MDTRNDLSNKFALDVNGMGALRQSAKTGSPEALKGAAQQFEALFVNMMMKSMREATPQDGPMDSQTTKTFTTMLDQQMSQNIAKKGMGLADMLVKQLSNKTDAQALALGADNNASTALDNTLNGLDSTSFGGARSLYDAQRLQRAIDAAGGNDSAGSLASDAAKAGQPAHVRSFQEKLATHAEEASRATGIPAKFMLGQAALESGWGKRVIKGTDGSNSHNLFGIKAGADWKGKVAEAVTTEYVNGKAQRKVERFRAYDSYADSFKDYAKLLASNPRYEKVLASGGDASHFAQGLQRAGYATDPHYASKLTRIIKQSLVG